MRTFKWLSGDNDFAAYGGTWYRRVGFSRYHIIRLTNMDDACGRDNEGCDTYNVELLEIDFNIIPQKQVDDALKYCGYEDGTGFKGEEITTLHILDAIVSYGCYAPLDQYNGNNFNKLIAAAKRQSKAYDNDHDAHYHAKYERPVNKLGSTAAEYASGDLLSPIYRGIMEGNKGAEIVAKMYGATNEDINKIKGR